MHFTSCRKPCRQLLELLLRLALEHSLQQGSKTKLVQQPTVYFLLAHGRSWLEVPSLTRLNNR
jgi:hypothetical protein